MHEPVHMLLDVLIYLHYIYYTSIAKKKKKVLIYLIMFSFISCCQSFVTILLVFYLHT